MYTWHEPTSRTTVGKGRETFALLAAGAVFAIAALSAAGQSLQIRFDDPPSVLEAGATWQTEVKVVRAGRPVSNVRPEIVFTDSAGVRHVFRASPAAKHGVYRVKIQLPDGGRWSYEVRVGEHVYDRGVVRAKLPYPF